MFSVTEILSKEESKDRFIFHMITKTLNPRNRYIHLPELKQCVKNRLKHEVLSRPSAR